jgi:hypothetical protein
MGLILIKIRWFSATAGVLFALAACSRMSEIGFDSKMALGSVSTVDRCTDFMRRAFPNGDIDVAGSQVDTSMASGLVTVQGVRKGVPENSPYARTVEVECHFEGGVLTGFRWIAGPIRAATTGQAP